MATKAKTQKRALLQMNHAECKARMREFEQRVFHSDDPDGIIRVRLNDAAKLSDILAIRNANKVKFYHPYCVEKKRDIWIYHFHTDEAVTNICYTGLSYVDDDDYCKITEFEEYPVNMYQNITMLDMATLNLTPIHGGLTQTLRGIDKVRHGVYGYVYLVREREPDNSGLTSYVKIGFTRNRKQRLATLQTGNPRVLFISQVIASTEPRRLERALHLLFKDIRVHGEWFDMSNDIATIFGSYGVVEDELAQRTKRQRNE